MLCFGMADRLYPARYEEAANAFAVFNRKYPLDPRTSDTTLWIAESVAKFADRNNACPVYQYFERISEKSGQIQR